MVKDENGHSRLPYVHVQILKNVGNEKNEDHPLTQKEAYVTKKHQEWRRRVMKYYIQNQSKGLKKHETMGCSSRGLRF